MCEITVYKGEDKIAENVTEFRFEDGKLLLKRLFEPDTVIENVTCFQWREKDDTLRISHINKENIAG